jgi:hypothetical protein
MWWYLATSCVYLLLGLPCILSQDVDAPSPLSDGSTNVNNTAASGIKPPTTCSQCTPLSEENRADGTQCPRQQQWGQSINHVCGPDTGLGCELSRYANESIPLNITFENVNGSAIKPECDFRPVIPTNNESGFVMMFSTGINCTGNLDIFLRVISPCYQQQLFEYGFEGHSLVTPCTGDGSSKGSPNPVNRFLDVKIQLDVYKYGVVAGPHVRGVANLFSASCAWYPGTANMKYGTVEISPATKVCTPSFSLSVLCFLLSVFFSERSRVCKNDL